MQTCDISNENLLDFDHTLKLFLEKSIPVGESVYTPTELTLNRICSDDILSPISLPLFNNSAMDGYALHVSDDKLGVVGVKTFDIIGTSKAGTPFTGTVSVGCGVRIFTGGKIPDGCNCVVMQEDCDLDNGLLEVFPPLKKHSHFRMKGDEISSGDTIITKGTLIEPKHLGMISSVGIVGFNIFRKVKVGVFFTGDELKYPGDELVDGHIFNSNEYAFVGILNQLNCEIINLGIIPDEIDIIKSSLVKLTHKVDLILTTGGASVGDHDLINPACKELGSVEVWKSKIKPGKPVMLASIDGCPVIGLPGNTVSSFVTLYLIAIPFMKKMQGSSVFLNKYTIKAINFDWSFPRDRREFARVIDGNSGLEIYSNGFSNIFRSISSSDGLAEMTENKVFKKGDLVKFYEFQ